jgi:hypothetical protein
MCLQVEGSKVRQAREATTGPAPRWRDVLVGLSPRRWELWVPMPAAAVEQAIDGWSTRRAMPGTWRLINGPPRLSRDGDRFVIRPWPLRWDLLEVVVRSVPEGSVVSVRQSIRPRFAIAYAVLFGWELAPVVVVLSPTFAGSVGAARVALSAAWALGSGYLLLRLLAAWARRVQQRQFNYWLSESLGSIDLFVHD